MRAITLAVAVVVVPLPARSQARDPVFDVHLHANAADSEGPPPLAMCTPMKFPAWDPVQPYGRVFMQLLKEPPCGDPVWSPTTDEELLTRTLEELERRRVYGVLSATPERVATWMRASPGRFLGGLAFSLRERSHRPRSCAASTPRDASRCSPK